MRKICCFLFVLILLTAQAALAEQSAPIKVDKLPFADGEALMQVTFFKIGAEDSILVQCGGETMLIDCGILPSGQEVVDYLKERGITRIDYAMNTHPHDDHIQGFEHLIHDACVQEFLYTFPEDANNNMKNALRAMKENGVSSRRVGDGYVMSLGDAKLEVIQREEKWFSENNRSAMVKVTYGDCTMLLAADVELDGQNLLLNTTPDLLKADILKYPHHGVDKAGWNFLKHVGAELAVITNSRYNVKVTRKDAEKRDLPLVYTYNGPITFRCDGTIWLVDQQI